MGIKFKESKRVCLYAFNRLLLRENIKKDAEFPVWLGIVKLFCNNNDYDVAHESTGIEINDEM